MDEDSILSSQLSKAAQESAVDIVLSTSPYDYFALLEIDPTTAIGDFDVVSTTARKTFRRKSLLLHPDRNKHPEAAPAFARLKKAEQVISGVDDESVSERNRLVQIYNDIVSTLGLRQKEEIRARIALILQELVLQEEADKHNRQQREAARLAEQTRHRKDQESKKQRERQWEDERDIRVANWRAFAAKTEKSHRHKVGKNKNKNPKKLKKLA